MQNDLSNVERRVRRYWFTDGIGELVGGAMLVLMGIYFALQNSLEELLGGNSILGVILQNGFFLFLFIGGWLLAQWLINLLKVRLTYPRTGYVEYQTNHERSSKWTWILFAALCAASGAFIVLLVRLFQSFDAMVAITGLIGAVLFMIFRTRSSGLRRFGILAGISLMLGLVLSVSGLPMSYNIGLFYALMGICVSISGGLTLQRYLRRNSMPGEG